MSACSRRSVSVTQGNGRSFPGAPASTSPRAPPGQATHTWRCSACPPSSHHWLLWTRTLADGGGAPVPLSPSEKPHHPRPEVTGRSTHIKPGHGGAPPPVPPPHRWGCWASTFQHVLQKRQSGSTGLFCRWDPRSRLRVNPAVPQGPEIPQAIDLTTVPPRLWTQRNPGPNPDFSFSQLCDPREVALPLRVSGSHSVKRRSRC